MQLATTSFDRGTLSLVANYGFHDDTAPCNRILSIKIHAGIIRAVFRSGIIKLRKFVITTLKLRNYDTVRFPTTRARARARRSYEKCDPIKTLNYVTYAEKANFCFARSWQSAARYFPQKYFPARGTAGRSEIYRRRMRSSGLARTEILRMTMTTSSGLSCRRYLSLAQLHSSRS